MPAFHNVEANFRFKTKSGGMVKYYTTYGIASWAFAAPILTALT